MSMDYEDFKKMVKKLPIVLKAYVLNCDKFEEGHYYTEFVSYATSLGKAKTELLKECDGAKLLYRKDVSKHKLRIVKDDGLYRELECGTPGTGNMRFRIVTYPGGLLFTGDMGTFVFERTEDMFRFFRGDSINSGYWAEKCVAESIYGNGIRKFDADEFRAAIKEHFDDYFEDCVDHEEKDVVWDEIKESILSCDDNEWELVTALQNFWMSDKISKFEFTDFWDGFTSCVKTYHYIWCLYALVWAIELYDLLVKLKAESDFPEGLKEGGPQIEN